MILLLFFLLNACTQVDNYLLGKDNTPQPEALEPMTPKVTLTERWSIPVGKINKSSAYSKMKPVIDHNTLYMATTAGIVQAVNIKDGKVIWSKKLDSGIISGPTVANGFIAVGTSNSKIAVLQQNNGKELWQKDVSSAILSKPVIIQGKIIAKTVDGNLYAFEIRSGEKLWVSEHGSPSLILKASSSPVVLNNELVLVGYSDGKMDAVDLKSGQVVWQRSLAYANGASDVERLVDIDADPIVQGNYVLLGSYQGYIGALSFENGDFIWRKPASIYKNMVTNQNNLFISDSNDVIWSINKYTGRVNWKQVALKARGLTEPVLFGDRLLIGDHTGILHVLSIKNGEFLSRLPLGSPITTAPVTANNDIYVVTANGKLNQLHVG